MGEQSGSPGQEAEASEARMCHQEGGLRFLTSGQLPPSTLEVGRPGLPHKPWDGRGDVSFHLEVLLVMKKPRMGEQDGTPIRWLGHLHITFVAEGARCGGGDAEVGAVKGTSWALMSVLPWAGGGGQLSQAS